MLTVVAMVALPAAAAGTVCPSGNTVSEWAPESITASMKRFGEEYWSTSHHYDPGNQAHAKPMSAGVLDAMKNRNFLRAASRVLTSKLAYGDHLSLTRRFCGLQYEKGAGEYDCSPVDAHAYGPAFLDACWGAMPTENSTCLAQDAGAGKIDMLKYSVSVAPPFVLATILAIVFPTLCLLWYLLRCCQLAGGRKPSAYLAGDSCCKALCGFVCPAFIRNPRGREHPGYSSRSLLSFRIGFFAFSLLALGGGIAGMIGNRKLKGLADGMDCAIFSLSNVIGDAQGIMSAINAVVAGANHGLDPDPVHVEVDMITCLVADAQKKIQDNSHDILAIRWLAVLVVSCGVIAICLTGVIASAMRSQVLSCCIAINLSWLSAIALLSLGLHGMLALIFGDLCVEMDLALHVPKGEYVNVGFVPEGMLPCGKGSAMEQQLQEMEISLVERAQGALEAGGNLLVDFCNNSTNSSAGLGTPYDFTALGKFWVDCSAISGLGKLLNGTGRGRYSKGVYNLDTYSAATEQIMLGDPGNSDPDCLNPVSVLPSNTCPDKDMNNDCETAAGLHATTLKNLTDCADPSTGCLHPVLYSLSCATVSATSYGQLARYLELRNNKIRPMLRCEFVKDIFVGMYMPMCVEAISGFVIVLASNGLVAVLMLLMLPFSVLATKRLDRSGIYGAGQNGRVIPDTTITYHGA